MNAVLPKPKGLLHIDLLLGLIGTCTYETMASMYTSCRLVGAYIFLSDKLFQQANKHVKKNILIVETNLFLQFNLQEMFA